MSASPYIRLKLLLAQPTPDTTGTGGLASSSSVAVPPAMDLLLRKVEVARSTQLVALKKRLSSLYHLVSPSFAVAESLTNTMSELSDEELVKSNVASQFMWQIMESEEEWNQAMKGKDKLLIKLTPIAMNPSAAASSSSDEKKPFDVRVHMRPVMPKKSPAPWPKYNPDPKSLPLIILSNDEHDWEVLDDEDFDRMDADSVEAKSNCGKSISSTSASASAVGKKIAAKKGTVSKIVPARPNRVVPEALLSKLTGGAQGPVGTASIASVTFAVNSTSYTVSNPDPTLKLADYLRYDLGITGQKIACGEGGCGACTVVLSQQDAKTGQLVQFSTNACVHPVCALDGWAVTTTEGLGSEHTKLHPIQKAMVDNWGTQCGYCTPGFVMSMYGLLANNPTPSQQDVEDRFDGNICRCTGYRPILKAMRTFASGQEEEKKSHAGACNGRCSCNKGGCGSSASASACAPKKLSPCGKGDGGSCSSSAKDSCASKGICCGSKKDASSGVADVEDLVLSYDPSNPAHNINPFPSSLLEHNYEQNKQSKKVTWSSSPDHLWLVPQSLSDVYQMLSFYAPNDVCKLVVGNTSIGVEKYYTPNPASDNPTVFINVANLSELKAVNLVANDGLYIGAANSINTLLSVLEAAISSTPSVTTSWVPLVRHMKVVANTGIRNIASFAGNLMLAKNHPEFPSDLMTIFAAVGASLTLTSGSHGSRSVDVTNFPSTVLYQDEVVQQMHLPFTPPNFVFDSYKIRARAQNAHPIINSAFHLMFAPARSSNGNLVIQSSNIIIGGLVETGIFQATNTMAYLAGKELSATTMAGAIAQLDAEAVPGGRVNPNSTFYINDPAYRHSLVLTTFYKFFMEQMAAAGVTIPGGDSSAYEWYVRPVSSGVEVYTPDVTTSPVGQAIPKVESQRQTTGEAKYVDDLVMPPNGLYGSYVYSTVATGTLTSLDASAAMAMPGVFKFISAVDIASLPNASNNCGSYPGDEEIFASSTITTAGQALGMILADTRAHADAAALAVVQNYATSPAPPAPLVTIADAIKANSFFLDNQYQQRPPPITCGNFQTAYAAAPNKLSGTNNTSGQTHFFMETQTCYCVPAENDSLYVHSSSQGPTDIRGIITRCTGLPANKVIVSTRRTGGAYGGKLSRSHPIACATAIAARITNRPVRAQNSRTADMDMFGKRPGMYFEYQVGFDNTGKILALNVDAYQQGGHTLDANFGTMSMCLLWADNAYYVPNFTITGFTCKTNTPTNTAMRGPGAFKSIWHMEVVIEAIAANLKISPDAVRANNFYQNGQLTPYQQPVNNITMQTVWSTLQTQAKYSDQQTAVAAFNVANKWRKRGVHMTAVKYGITDPGNQCGILLNVMQDDGTILVSTTGVELGQGLNTKIAQTIAYELNVDMSLIIMDDNATNIVANGSQTGGSATSESCCAAAVLACTDLNSRLAPVVKANPGKTWQELIPLAAAALVNLQVSALYNLAAPAMPFTYFVWAAACTQIELDVLTGSVEILNTDIVYDAGDALNPAVDIGQIEGAFVIGTGHFLTEDVVHDETSGRLLTRGTWDYHPPSSQDIPQVFNVTLLGGAKNTAPGSVLGSKATAEPPMMLSNSVYFAVKDAIGAFRSQNGQSGWFDLPTPASCQTVQLACGIKPANLVM